MTLDQLFESHLEDNFCTLLENDRYDDTKITQLNGTYYIIEDEKPIFEVERLKFVEKDNLILVTSDRIHKAASEFITNRVEDLNDFVQFITLENNGLLPLSIPKDSFSYITFKDNLEEYKIKEEILDEEDLSIVEAIVVEEV